MKIKKRFIYQVIIWFIVWFSQWAIQKFSSDFFTNNVAVFVSQIAIIFAVSYWLASKFLAQKKYLLFSVISMLLVIGFTFFCDIGSRRQTVPPPPPHMTDRQPPPMGERLQRPPDVAQGVFFPPSKTFINFLLIITAFFIATFFEGYIFLQEKEAEARAIKTENLETELKLLKSQINPHFLFNALNNIYALTHVNIEKTQDSIIQLSDMLRYVLYECDQQLVSLEKEIAYIQNYIKLFQLKSSKPFNVTLKENELNTSLQIAPMLLIPFIENAFKHSSIEVGEKTFITIEFKELSPGKIQFFVENSLPENRVFKDDVGGIGLVNVRKRLEILYAKRHELTVMNNGTYRVKLILDLA